MATAVSSGGVIFGAIKPDYHDRIAGGGDNKHLVKAPGIQEDREIVGFVKHRSQSFERKNIGQPNSVEFLKAHRIPNYANVELVRKGFAFVLITSHNEVTIDQNMAFLAFLSDDLISPEEVGIFPETE